MRFAGGAIVKKSLIAQLLDELDDTVAKLRKLEEAILENFWFGQEEE